MKLFLLGRRASLTGWLEEAATAFVAAGHDVRLGIVRDPRLHPRLQEALAMPIAQAIAARVRRFSPDLVLAIGGFHVPAAVLERIAALANRPPLIGWVGDAFDETVRGLAALYDLVGYTDSGMVERHRALGFAATALFTPHAVDPRAPVVAARRRRRLVFVATATPGRRAVVDRMVPRLTLYGSGWKGGSGHRLRARRVDRSALPRIYAGHAASLNIRNEVQVLTGLNQRNFQPYVQATPVITDAQPDLPLCFDLDREVLVWRDVDELNDVCARLIKSPEGGEAVGRAGRRRVLAEHTYGHRLAAMAASVQ